MEVYLQGPCEEYAKHLSNEAAQICFKSGSRLEAGPMEMAEAYSGLILSKEFAVPDEVDIRFLGLLVWPPVH